MRLTLLRSRVDTAGILLLIVGITLWNIGCDGDSTSGTGPEKLSGYEIAYPTGGETFAIGDSVPVRIMTDNPYSSVLELSVDGGQTWVLVGSQDQRLELLGGDTTIKIVIPATVTGWVGYDPVEVSSISNQAKLRVYQYDLNEPSFEMKSTFNIVARQSVLQ